MKYVLFLVLAACNVKPEPYCYFNLEATVNGKSVLCHHGEANLFGPGVHLWNCEDGGEYYDVTGVRKTRVCPQ